MKFSIFIAASFTLINIGAHAQISKKKTNKAATHNLTRSATSPKKSAEIISLNSESIGNAKASGTTLTIHDPIVNALSLRANGNPVYVSKSGIIGMPKRAYGFANGKLLLHSTSATSSGTITGSSSVGTGSSLSTIGSTGGFIGLNGKSPQSGIAMWGNSRGLVNPYSSKVE